MSRPGSPWLAMMITGDSSARHIEARRYDYDEYDTAIPQVKFQCGKPWGSGAINVNSVNQTYIVMKL